MSETTPPHSPLATAAGLHRRHGQKQPLLGLSVVSNSPSSLGLGGAAAPPWPKTTTIYFCLLHGMNILLICLCVLFVRSKETPGWRHRLDITMLLHHLPSDLLARFVLNRRTSRYLLCPNIVLPSHLPLPALLPSSSASSLHSHLSQLGQTTSLPFQQYCW
jgi:hypothetical protein